jgi:hypothetical protein
MQHTISQLNAQLLYNLHDILWPATTPRSTMNLSLKTKILFQLEFIGIDLGARDCKIPTQDLKFQSMEWQTTLAR